MLSYLLSSSLLSIFEIESTSHFVVSTNQQQSAWALVQALKWQGKKKL
jgi:hypothetical protein